MANIKHDATVVNRIASNVDSDIAKIRESLTKLETILEEVKTAWSGADATSYYTKAIEKRNGMVKVVNALDKMPGSIRGIAKMLEQAEGDLAQR